MINETNTVPKRRGRPKKVESYADWMAKIDAQVDAAAKAMERNPPTFAYLHPAQKRIVQMLIDHLRSLPCLKDGERSFDKREWVFINRILTELYAAKYPQWTQKTPEGRRDANAIPNGEGKDFGWMLRNCAGHAPTEVVKDEED